MESLRVLDRETVPLPCNRELPRTPFSRTSENTPSETVWKIAMGSEIGVPEAAKRAERAPIGRLLPPKKHAREAYSYFPNSFSTHSDE
jgi:hypothetical protein